MKSDRKKMVHFVPNCLLKVGLTLATGTINGEVLEYGIQIGDRVRERSVQKWVRVTTDKSRGGEGEGLLCLIRRYELV